MNAMFGVRWNDNVKRGTLAGFMVAALFATSFLSTPEAQQSLSTATSNFVSVIVRSEPGTNGDRIERVVQDLGGTVEEELKIINGYVARVPADRVHQLKSDPAVSSVTMNGRVQMLSHNDDYGSFRLDTGSLNYVAQGATGAIDYYKAGITGRGVDVAVIDSGVSPVEGLARPGKIIYGPDLSFESQSEPHRYLDTFGHGTHMAGIIAGMDSTYTRGQDFFAGVAPMSRIVSVKVADAEGATDVSQIIAAIDWVVQHRRDNGMNIRVLNLSFGTDGTQDYRLDPLTYAAEVAWRKGIVVVVSAGNRGYGSEKLNNPAYDPFVIAVGASDPKGTWTTEDDQLAGFSSHGDGARNPDVVAPGKSIVGLRVPGSALDTAYPEGRVGERFFRGSGTSQAAAVVSGAAALVIQQRPNITPDQVKALLKQSAERLPHADDEGQGAGLIDLQNARWTPTPVVAQTHTPSSGLGSLDASRGSSHLEDPDEFGSDSSGDGSDSSGDGIDSSGDDSDNSGDDSDNSGDDSDNSGEGSDEDDSDDVLDGERDIFGQPWDANRWSLEAMAGTSWAGGTWNANRWSGDAWSANRWSGVLWDANRWSGEDWDDDADDDDDDWSANRWSANRWSGGEWLSNRWSSDTWSSNRWSSAGWGY